jgi:DNA replication protein DnaC
VDEKEWIGRSKDMSSIMNKVMNTNHRFLTVYGGIGVGKKYTANATCLYMLERKKFKNGILKISITQ